MHKQPLVSVIVPIYNAEQFMGKCIDSILGQTLKDIEVILINDGSSDRSGEIADKYTQNDIRVKVIHQDNSGPSTARNNGISMAKGKYIGFVDSDDYIEHNMYEELYSIASDKNVSVAMCSYTEKKIYADSSMSVNANLESNKVYNKKGIADNVISTFPKSENYGFYSLWNKIYLRSWLLESGIKIDVNRDHGEDWWFNINIFSKINSFIYIDKELYNYIHINSNSLMFKYRENQFELFLDGRMKMKEIIQVDYIDYNEFDKRFVYEFSSYIIRTFKEIESKPKRKKLINTVLNNNEVINTCKNIDNLPIHFKFTSFLIKHRLNNLAFISYRCISLLR